MLRFWYRALNVPWTQRSKFVVALSAELYAKAKVLHTCALSAMPPPRPEYRAHGQYYTHPLQKTRWIAPKIIGHEDTVSASQMLRTRTKVNWTSGSRARQRIQHLDKKIQCIWASSQAINFAAELLHTSHDGQKTSQMLSCVLLNHSMDFVAIFGFTGKNRKTIQPET